MSPEINPVKRLNPKEFASQAARWASYITESNSDDLKHAFLLKDDSGVKRMDYVDFSVQHLAKLVSTVGIQQIQARFLVATNFDGGSYFSMVLYATDILGARISAYYLPVGSGGYGVAKPAPGAENFSEATEPDAQAAPAEQVPHDLVKGWVTAWAQAPEIKSAMFVTSYGPLQGYTFSLGDFLEQLFSVQPFTAEQMVRISFGLHEYYPAVPADADLTQTFGLVLRLFPMAPKPVQPVTSATTQNTNPPPQDDSDPFFDLSVPCPPGT